MMRASMSLVTRLGAISDPLPTMSDRGMRGGDYATAAASNAATGGVAPPLILRA